MEALKILFEKVRTLLEEHDALDRALPNQADDGDSESDEEETSESKHLKKDYAIKTKEVELLKKAVPEGWCCAIKLTVAKQKVLQYVFLSVNRLA